MSPGRGTIRRPPVSENSSSNSRTVAMISMDGIREDSKGAEEEEWAEVVVVLHSGVVVEDSVEEAL